MDTITQAALGAAIGEVTLGKSLGNKAIIWGAAIATIPDLDVVAYPLMDTVSQLGWHRGISHSLLLSVVLAPVLGWLMHKIHKDNAPFRKGMLLGFLAMVTHILLDCFTMYGTQIFAPFSDYRVAWNSIFIIDPFYTVPLSVGVLVALFLKRNNPSRFTWAATGLGISTAYIILGLIVKLNINAVSAENLDRNGVVYSRFMTNPAPFTIFLWRSLAEGPDGYYVSYHSVFDESPDQPLLFIPKNDSLLSRIADTRAVNQLRWFSDGYYSVSATEGKTVFQDLRFGEFSTGTGGGNFGLGEWREPAFMFAFHLYPEMNGNWTFEQQDVASADFGTAFDQLLKRMFGDSES